MNQNSIKIQITAEHTYELETDQNTTRYPKIISITNQVIKTTPYPTTEVEEYILKEDLTKPWRCEHKARIELGLTGENVIPSFSLSYKTKEQYWK